jgi:hypothetical protein
MAQSASCFGSVSKVWAPNIVYCTPNVHFIFRAWSPESAHLSSRAPARREQKNATVVRSASDAAMLQEGKKSVVSSDNSAVTAETSGGTPRCSCSSRSCGGENAQSARRQKRTCLCDCLQDLRAVSEAHPVRRVQHWGARARTQMPASTGKKRTTQKQTLRGLLLNAIGPSDRRIVGCTPHV